MTDALTEKSLWDAVCEQPDDWPRRLVLADFYEEGGRAPEAEALRWMVRTKSRAFREVWQSVNRTGFVWFSYQDRDKGANDPESDLPRWLFDHLPGGEPGGSTDYRKQRTYPDRLASEKALLAAFVKSGGKPWPTWTAT